MTRFGILTRARRGVARGRGRSWWLGALVAIMAVGLVACNSTNTFPIDFFSEMHYMKSFRHQEPPRLDSPPRALPYARGDARVGNAVQLYYVTPVASEPLPLIPETYTLAEMKDIPNPLGDDPKAIEAGKKLFAVNCVVCHGAEADGKGIAAGLIFTANNQPPPADLRKKTHPSPVDGQPTQLTDGEYYWVLTHGYPTDDPIMPPFGQLLTSEQRWALISYLRSIETGP